MQRKMVATCIVLMILATTILPLVHIVGATDATLTLSNAELSAQFAKEWGPGIIAGINDIGTGVRFDFTNLGSAGTAMGDNYPVSPLAGGAPDSVGGWGDFQAYIRCRLVFTNLGLDGVSVNLFMNTGWTNVDWHRDTYWENGWIYVGANESKVVTLDFSSATAWNAQDDPVPEWRYLGGTSGVIVRRLTEVSNIGFQVCGNGAGSLVVSSTTPSDTVVALPDAEVSAQFAKETGPANLVAVTVLRGMGVRLDFTGLDSSTGTVVGDSFPVSALAGGAWKDYGNGFAGPYDFSGYAKYMLLFTNVGPAEVKVNLKMNTGWTNALWGSPERDTFWQNSWTTVPPGESRIVTLDFWSAQVWNAMNDPVPEWRHADGTIGVIVRRLDEVSDIGFQILGSGQGSIILSGDLTLALSDAELNTQFRKETGPGAIAAITDIPGPGVKFDFTGLRTDVGTIAGDNFPVSPLAGGAYKTYGVANPFSTSGDFFEYTKYSMIFTNLGPNPVTVNLKMNTGWTIPPPEYAAAWRDTFWQSNWTIIAPGESEVLTLNFSSAQVYNAADEQEYRACADGTTGVRVWRLDEVSDIGFQVLGNGNASIIVSAFLHPLEVYVDASYTSSTPGWGYDHFAKIQDGIDAIIAGGIVHVHDGTYNEALYISKSLTLKADSSPIVTGSQSFATKYGNREAVIFIKGATNVVLNGLDIEGQGFTGDGIKNYGIIYENSSGTVENCTVSPNMIGNMYSFGIAGWDRSNLSVEDCTIKNFGRVGVYATNVANIKLHGNTIIGQPYTQSDLVNYGVEIEDWDGASTAEIVENEIYNCGDSNPSMLWSSAGIIADIWRIYYDLLPSAVSIEHNDIHHNFEAIEIVSNSLSYAHYNDIHDNLYGVWTDTDVYNNNATFDARFNWWGDASGPSQATTNPSGLGNDAGDYVDYSPWLGFVVGTTPMTWHVNPSGGSDALQEAIDEASDGDTIIAHPGTYFENQTVINKSLTVTSSSGADATIIDGSLATLTDGGLIRITAATGDVTFSGFTLRNPGATAAGDRFGIYASSSSPGPTYTISYNKIYGTNNPDDTGDYGIYAAWGKEKLVFTHNLMTQHGSNPILIEVQTGETDVSYNTLDEGAYGSVVYFSMTHDGTNITTLQKVSHNVINVGTGIHTGSDYYGGAIVFRSAFLGLYGNGTYTNVQITDNVINNLKGYRRAISLSDDASGDGSGGEISSPTITGNIVTGTGEIGSIGIQLRGLVTNANVSDNQINNVDTGILCAKGINGNCGPRTTITNNDISGCSTGINITDSAVAIVECNLIENNGEGLFIDSNNNIIENNTITGNSGSYSGIHLTATADGNEIHFNNIEANVGTNVYGVYKEGGSTVNATYNWWGDQSGPCHPTLNPTGLGDRVSDYVNFIPWLLMIRDVAIVNATASPTTVAAGQTVTITVTAKNYGSDYENFTVTAYYDSTAIATQNVTNLLPNWNTTLTFSWDTTGMSRGNYTMKAVASTVLGEINTANNVFMDGKVQVLWHDVAVVSIVSDRTWVFQGHSANINVTVKNNGDFPETPTVTLYYNITAYKIIGTQNVTLSPGQSRTIVFSWDTTGVPYCHNYTLTAVAAIPEDNNPADNTLSDGNVKVRIMGDVNGDGTIDGRDISAASKGFGSAGPNYVYPGSPPTPRWNPDLDFNLDNTIDGRDIALVARSFGKSC